MNRFALTAAAALSLVPALATAQPGPSSDPIVVAPAPDAPPQNEAWSNVSHINGQIVPVGERNDYLLSQKKTNISTNPIGWLMGFYGVSVSQAVTANLAVRVDANYMDFDGMKGFEGGVSLPIYFKRTYYGPFIEPGVIVRSMTSTNDCYDCYGTDSPMSETHTMVGPEVLVGYHMTFDSGLNAAAAFGVARDLSAQSSDRSSDENLTVAGYFRVGYAF